jgi:putative chitinase
VLTEDVLRQLYPSAKDAIITAFASQAGAVLAEFGISDRQNRLHFFLAQIGHESGGLRITEENLNYSGPRMMQVWPSRFPTLGSTQGFAGNPQRLANKVYGGRLGNNTNDDGWTYRGRGFIQITGKDGYKQVDAADGNGLDLVANPDRPTQPQHALRVACAFWEWKNLNPKCDAGDFVGVTKRINGGTIGLQDRFNWLEKVQSLVSWPLGGTAPMPPPLNEVTLNIPQLKAVQLKLEAMGLYDGSIDGVFGKRSRAGLKAFQSANGLPPSGRLTQVTLDKLGV